MHIVYIQIDSKYSYTPCRCSLPPRTVDLPKQIGQPKRKTSRTSRCGKTIGMTTR